MRNYAEEVKEKLSIVDVVGAYVKLEKSGKNWKARCPFHNEKTASFYVSGERNSFNCFGCGVKGDIFTFVEKFEGLDFMGALKSLAEKAGITMTDRSGGKDKDEKDRLFKILEEATVFFENIYESSPEAKSYVAGRGIKPETAKDMRIGYAPDDWRILRTFLKSKKYSDEELVSVGLIKRTDSGKEPYDVFRDRVMFPIADSSGRVVAFSGRILKDNPKAPKYLNSPETVLYSKTKVLYGLDKAKQHIRKADYAILVEGQMDMVMSHQAGLRNTVAVSGTGLADDVERAGEMTGLGLITRLSRNLVIAFDSDNAGIKAALRAAKIALSLGLDVKIAHAATGKDPADIIREDPKVWAKAVKDATHAVEFALNRVVDRKLSPKDTAKAINEEVLPLIALSESSMEQARLIEVVSSKSGFKSDALWKDLARTNVDTIIRTEHLAMPKESLSRKDRLLRMAFGILFSEDSSSGEFGKSLRETVGAEVYNSYLALPKQDQSALATSAEVLYGEQGTKDKERLEIIQSLNREILKTSRDEVGFKLKALEKEGKNTDALLKEYIELSKRITT